MATVLQHKIADSETGFRPLIWVLNDQIIVEQTYRAMPPDSKLDHYHPAQSPDDLGYMVTAFPAKIAASEIAEKIRWFEPAGIAAQSLPRGLNRLIADLSPKMLAAVEKSGIVIFFTATAGGYLSQKGK